MEEFTKRGLTALQATAKLLEFGENTVYHRRKSRPIIAFIRKFNSPLLLLLIGAAIVQFFVGASTSGTILILMVLLSAVLDFVNSFRSEIAVETLVNRVVTTATVWRDGKKQEIQLKRIVPGDIVLLSAGDVVPADGIILQSDDFFVNQSALTGESYPVEKIVTTDALSKQKFEVGQNFTVLMGTSVVSGFATIEVVNTGRKTFFGSIADRLAAQKQETDFEKNIRQFSLFIMRVAFVLVGFVFLANTVIGRDWLESFIFAIAIAIGLTPELLPVIISVSLSHGAAKMAKKEVIVKNLPSIQNFGSMNILCTDKTGTLTKDQIELVRYVNMHNQDSENVLRYAYINSSYHTGVRNPLDGAVMTYKKIALTGFNKIDEIPFDFQRKRQSVVVSSPKGRIMVTKGAPEDIIKLCRYYFDGKKSSILSKPQRRKAMVIFNSLSQDGYRVLAVATRPIKDTRKVYEPKDEKDLVLEGFVAFLDPPKMTAKQALEELAVLGIETKILTGDNELLTQKICRDIGLTSKGLLMGSDLTNLSDEQLQQRAVETTIFARITPEQKERIIQALRRAGNVIGYLGDGINDAPALRAADVGISVNNAVDVAKETADIILLRKSLRVLKDGVLEGRKTFHNSLAYIMMGLSSNFGNMFSMMAASVFLPFLPMLPAQILLNNFLYDSSQLSLPSDNIDQQEIAKPTVWSLPFIKKYMLVFGSISSVFDLITFGLLYWVFGLMGSQFQTGWFIESIATQVFVIYIIRTKKIPFLQSRPGWFLLANTLLAVFIAWLIPFLPLGAWFEFTPLPFYVLITIAVTVAIYLFMVEAVKHWFYKFRP